ncbi:unnamed protein product [Diatraea saccharalis]|uniref:Peptidase S1 domain-containing protein n=1 Tax=Diatraea saccharalis TaxID=40085 RepID=A0A9N9RE58_9NEOP|nr:unnamed protein product [Diatraea saccharalis]
MPILNFFILISFCFINVKAMAIEGRALARYDPCGLGIVHFDRLTERVWRGVINLGLYSSLLEVEIGVQFEKKVRIYAAPQNTSIYFNDDTQEFIFKPNGHPPMVYTFFLAVDFLAQNNSDVPTVTKFSLNNVTLCNDDIKAAQTLKSLNLTKESDKYQTHVCGRRSLGNTELVTMQTDAKTGDWPWHVAIFITESESNQTSYYCGGNIISRTAVVTAGHCVFKDNIRVQPYRITVIAGSSHHKAFIQPGIQTLKATDVILHPSYDASQATADIAIIKVNSFTYSAYVQPICVWGPVYSKNDLIGQIATVVGFGHDNDNNPSDVLRAAFIMIQNDTTCLNYSPAVYTKLINEFTICAGYGPTSGTNPRNGDSGGGLVIPVLQNDHKISWFLRGVLSKCGVSPGHTECDPRYYVVYTDVAPHYGWIYHHSGEKKAALAEFLAGSSRYKVSRRRFTNRWRSSRLSQVLVTA